MKSITKQPQRTVMLLHTLWYPPIMPPHPIISIVPRKIQAILLITRKITILPVIIPEIHQIAQIAQLIQLPVMEAHIRIIKIKWMAKQTRHQPYP